jgi:hypothetical protein
VEFSEALASEKSPSDAVFFFLYKSQIFQKRMVSSAPAEHMEVPSAEAAEAAMLKIPY